MCFLPLCGFIKSLMECFKCHVHVHFDSFDKKWEMQIHNKRKQTNRLCYLLLDETLNFTLIY